MCTSTKDKNGLMSHRRTFSAQSGFGVRSGILSRTLNPELRTLPNGNFKSVWLGIDCLLDGSHDLILIRFGQERMHGKTDNLAGGLF